jgi:hypothetical protein
MQAPPPGWPKPPGRAPDADAATVAAALEAMSATLAVAHSLVAAGRRVDLQGLDGEMGAICEATLALPPEQARSLKPRLIELRGLVDELAAAIAPP